MSQKEKYLFVDSLECSFEGKLLPNGLYVGTINADGKITPSDEIKQLCPGFKGGFIKARIDGKQIGITDVAPTPGSGPGSTPGSGPGSEPADPSVNPAAAPYAEWEYAELKQEVADRELTPSSQKKPDLIAALEADDRSKSGNADDDDATEGDETTGDETND